MSPNRHPLPFCAQLTNCLTCNTYLHNRYGAHLVQAGELLDKGVAASVPQVHVDGHPHGRYTYLLTDPDAPSPNDPKMGEASPGAWLRYHLCLPASPCALPAVAALASGGLPGGRHHQGACARPLQRPYPATGQAQVRSPFAARHVSRAPSVLQDPRRTGTSCPASGRRRATRPRPPTSRAGPSSAPRDSLGTITSIRWQRASSSRSRRGQLPASTDYAWDPWRPATAPRRARAHNKLPCTKVCVCISCLFTRCNCP